MKKVWLLNGLICTILISHSVGGSLPPKHEFRAVWIATVANLDWPSYRTASPDAQKEELIRILDALKNVGINALIFQVRTECDALYASEIEPWSYWLTGKQGGAPNPAYDPLAFAVEQAHMRGMELHAWFNPYRAEHSIGSYAIDANHVSSKHPEWILTFSKINMKLLDPGLPQVREYVTSVVMDVVRRYDVDGVHFDDYFYPYRDDRKGFYGISNEDDATFAKNSRGFSNRADWRRDNINLLVSMVHESIRAVKPFVKFGISPFGIWKKGVPEGIVGFDAYSEIYCDAVAWLSQNSVDYLTPQLYWPSGGEQDYTKLMPWWAEQLKGQHLYPGHAAYKMGAWSRSEMPSQVRLNRNTEGVLGSVFFRADNITGNTRNFADSLRNDLYRYPAITPAMQWKDVVPPNPPQELRYGPIAQGLPAVLIWNESAIAADGDSAFRYVVYRSTSSINPDDAGNIVDIAGMASLNPIPPETSEGVYYAVTALDRNSNESAMSNILFIEAPASPLLAYPPGGDDSITDEVTVSWHGIPDAESYHLQISTDSTFSSRLILNQIGLVDTFNVVKGLQGQQTYYWRVSACNAGGKSDFSEKSIFTCGLPLAPILATPEYNAKDVTLKTTFTWNAGAGAASYHFQLSRTAWFDENSIVAERSAITDTRTTVTMNEINRNHFWRIKSLNTVGESAWSKISRFTTGEATFIADLENTPYRFDLLQNYPNPFNAATNITYSLPWDGHVRITVYDMRGRELTTLVDAFKTSGRHKIKFMGQNLASGLYFYRITYADRQIIKRLIYLK